jgi:ESS family glutamate:Na+ symporter
VVSLDLVQTLALAGVVLFLGYAIRRVVRPLARHNIPAPVVGGLLVAVCVSVARLRGVTLLELDTTLQAPLMIAFFTSVGFGASVSLLRVGGPAVAVFLALSTVAAVAQNLVGGAVAYALDQNPLMGVLAGSVALTGGPATALAFADVFEGSGVRGAATLGVTAAMCGIVSGGLIGGPIGTRLIERGGLRPSPGAAPAPRRRAPATNVAEAQMVEPPSAVPEGEDVESYALLKALVAILVAMWIGGWLSRGFAALGWTLPAYIGAMLVAAVIRNLDDVTRWLGVSQRVLDDLGTVALSLFIVLALMTLRLWELASLALPLAAIVVAQILLVLGLCLGPVPRLMGRDYDAAVMSSGFCGFMLGTTANAMANMGALVEKFGPAPRAYLVVPMVGAFFIDFTNALIITGFVNLWR